MKESIVSLLQGLGLACWIEIKTETPRCVYFFGPFLSRSEALEAESGFIEDLENEGATAIKTKICRCRPTQLTIWQEEESLDALESQGANSFSLAKKRIFPA